MTMYVKPCAFCGSSARIDDEMRHNKRYYYVSCSSNECPVTCWTNNMGDIVEDVVKVWNTRPGENKFTPPDGYVLVPIDITADMAHAWQGGDARYRPLSSDENAKYSFWNEAYKRMLAVAPQPTVI